MGKSAALTSDELFARAEKARREAAALVEELAALRELRVLERDFRNVARQLAIAMRSIEITQTDDGLRWLLTEAEEHVTR